MEPRNLSQPTNPEPGLREQGDSASGHLKGEPLQMLSINELARCCSEETNKFLASVV